MVNQKRNKIDFGFAEFELEFTEELLFDEKHHELAGCVEWESYKISISTKQTDNMIRETLLHEIIHVILYMFNKGEGLVQMQNEDLTNSITRGLLILSRLNDNLIEELL